VGWKELLMLDYAFLYSLSLVIWTFLRGKLKNVKAFALVYSTGAHLVFLASLYTFSLEWGAPLLLLSYLASAVLSFKKPELLAEPYLYLAWSTAFALSYALRWSG